MEEKLKNYKVGVSFGRYYQTRHIFCSCGHVTVIAQRGNMICEKCGNTYIVNGGDSLNTNKSIIDGIFECVEKNDKYSHLKKKEIIVHYNAKKKCVYFNTSHDWEFKFNLKDRTATLIKNGKEVECNDQGYKNITRFFKCVGGERELIPIISTETSYYLYDYAFKEYGAIQYETVNKLGRALMRLLNSKKVDKLELFTFAGFGNKLEEIASVLDWMYSKETKPHKIFGVPKYMLSILRKLNKLSRYMIISLNDFDKAVGGNNVKIAVEIFNEESDLNQLIHSIASMIDLYKEYGYRDIRRLSLYLAREVKLEQGITSPSSAAVLLRDYVRMCKEMGIEPKEKYPKSLKKMHDIAQMNYQAKTDETKNAKMKEVVESEDYRNLVYRKKPYVIIAPQTTADLIKEGSSLSHCVASYVNDVIERKCKILFMRDETKIDEPLITIEVRDNNIRQVRGFGNRRAYAHEMRFIEEWAFKKNLNVSPYC